MNEEICVENNSKAENLRRHNEKIMKLISETKEYKKIQKIQVLYEGLMRKTDNEHKKEIYSKQYLKAYSIFFQRIGEYNKHWISINEEV